MSEPLPLYKQVKQSLLQRIRAGQMVPGDRVPSENDLVKEFSVSRITARQALGELAQEGWVIRVQGKGTFVAEPGASAGRITSGTIGVVVPRLKDAFTTRVIFGVEEVLVEAGFHLVLRSAKTLAQEAASIRDLVQARVVGLIVWPVAGQFVNDEIVSLALDGFPVVLVDRFLRGLQLDCVQSDNLRGGYMATQHLLELGHRRIAYVAGGFQHVTSVEERYLGFRTALRRAGIPQEDGPLWQVPDSGEWSVWRDWLRGKLEQRPDVTALFCENDDVAIKILGCLRELEIPVPERLSVVGFDDKEPVTEAPVPLTTVRQDGSALGRTAARLMLERIAEPTSSIQHVTLPVHLVERSSTAAPPAASGKDGEHALS